MAGQTTQVDIKYLESLLNDRERAEIRNETCRVVDHTAVRKRNCGI